MDSRNLAQYLAVDLCICFWKITGLRFSDDNEVDAKVVTHLIIRDAQFRHC